MRITSIYRKAFPRFLALIFMIGMLASLNADEALSAAAEVAADQQQVQATATVNTSRIFVGERFILTLEVSAPRLQNVRRPSLPELEGVTILSRTPTSTSSFSIVNGVSTASNGFRFTLEATNEGSFTIPPIEMEVDGEVYLTNELTINIQSRARMQQRGPQDDIYLRLELSNERPFSGEQINAQVVLYYKSEINVMSYQPSSAWRTEGFWLERVTDERGPRAETVIIDGMQFRRAVLMSYVLFPTRSGNVNIGEYSVNATVRQTSRFGDTSRFFDGPGRSQRTVTLRSEPVELSVRPLPTPQPPGFTGAVGQFQVSRSIENPEVIIGEPLEIETRFSGTGNVMLIDQPAFDFPEGFENFRPVEQIEVNKSPTGVSGSKTFTDVLIARRVGNYTLPAVEVSWFNPQLGRYQSTTLPAVRLAILRDEDQEFTFVDERRIRVSPATGLVRWFVEDEAQLSSRLWFRFLMVLPFFILIPAWIVRRRNQRLTSDIAYARSKNAMKRAEEQLGASSLFAAEQNFKDAYRMLHKSVAGYIADKQNLPETGLSDTYLISTVRKKGAPQPLLSRMDALFKTMTDISYSPGSGSATYSKDRNEAEAIIKELKKVL
ncbi:MAG: BatD family protein [Balneolia bacterium]|nr:BatD family protein [Balneolia bacterium]